ncbi:hypothetical protein [Nocardia beijingensis]
MDLIRKRVTELNATIAQHHSLDPSFELGNSFLTRPRHSEIVDKRNRYMHRAGAMPNRLDANSILNEMDACLSFVLANT